MSLVLRKHSKGYYAFIVSGAVSVSLLYTIFSNDSEALVQPEVLDDDYYSSSASAILSNDFNYGFGKQPVPDSYPAEVRVSAPKWNRIDANGYGGNEPVYELEAKVEVATKAVIEDFEPLNTNYQPNKQTEQLFFEADDGRPKIAIIIDDMGVRQNMTRPFSEITVPINFSFLPYAEGLAWQTDLMKASGHELMLHMPMEPSVEGQNPGPKALLTSLTSDTINEYINWNLARFTGFVGINNHMGSRFTENAQLMSIVLDRLKGEDLFFVDSRTSSKSTGYELAKQHGLKYEARDVFLDNDLSQEAIFKQFKQLEQIALKNGSAIAIGHPHRETLEALNLWLPTLEAKGFKVVKVSALLKQIDTLPETLTSQAKHMEKVPYSGGGY